MGDSAPSLRTSVYASPTWVRWQILALLLTFSFMSWFNRASMAAAGDEQIMPRYGISPETMGTVYSAFFLVYTVFMTPGGWFIDRFGARLALAVMGIGSALFGALTGSAVLFGAGLLVPALLVIRGLMGLCSAPVYPATGRVVSRWIPYPQRALANGLVTCAAPVGIACTYVGFGALMDVVGWPWAFVISGGITQLLALCWLMYATERPAEHPRVNAAELALIEQDEPAWNLEKQLPVASDRQEKSNWTILPSYRRAEERTQIEKAESDSSLEQPLAPPSIGRETLGWLSLLTNRSLVLLTLSYVAVNYFEYLFTFWIHHYFDDTLHMDKIESRNYAGIIFLAEAVGMVLGGWLSDCFRRRFGQRRGRAIVPVFGLIASAVFLILGLIPSQPGWLSVYWFALAVGAVGMCEGPFWTTAIELGGNRGGTAAALCNTGGNVGGLLAPIITPWVSGLFGWSYGIALGSLVCLVGATLWWWIDPTQRCGDTTSGEPLAQ